MSLAELDTKLADWKKNIQAASANLSAFETSPGYMHVRQKLSSLTGRSKTEIVKAIEEMEEVPAQFLLVSNIIARAGELRAALSGVSQFFGMGDRVAEIKRLLEGNSITLKTEEIPLEQRGLTGAEQTIETIAPKALFDQIQSRFAAATKAAALYETSTSSLTEQLGAAYEELEKLEKKGKAPAGRREKLDAIGLLIDIDPLTGLDKLVSALETTKPKPIKIEPKPEPKPVAKAEPKRATKVETHSAEAAISRTNKQLADLFDQGHSATPFNPGKKPEPSASTGIGNSAGLAYIKALDASTTKRLKENAKKVGLPTPKATKSLEDLINNPPKPETPKTLKDLINKDN